MDILPQLLVNSLIAGSIYALASAGLSLTYGMLRILNFAHGHLMMTGAYLFYMASVQWELGIALSSVFTLGAVVLLGALALRTFVLPFLRFNPFLVFVATLSLSTILESLVSMIYGVNVKSLTVGMAIGSKEISFWGYEVYITPIQVIIILSSIVFLSLLAFVIHSTSLGRRVRAISEHAYSAETLGISKLGVSYGVFIMGTLLAAFAGVMVGYETNMQPTMGNSYTIKAFAAMVLGGLGNIWGTVAGSYLLGLVENLSIGLEFGGFSVLGWEIERFSIPAGYKDAFAFVIILVVLLFRPEGLFKRAGRKA